MEGLDQDLQAIIDMKDTNPLVIGKMLRYAFADRGWPNKEHKGTVLDFMKKYDLPIFNTPRGKWGQSEADQNRQRRIKEYLNGEK